tara:strand:+ start:1908 stop:2672 length:765 start_codon:yes stop_codon:yes gene_type:complete
MIKKIYILICIFYNKIFSYIELYFLFKQTKIFSLSSLSEKGFEIINFENGLSLKNPESVVKANSYMTKDIIKNDDILEYIDLLFQKFNLKKIITDRTGYEYSIDFMISYTTYKIPNSELNKEIYANQWHNDKPFSENTLKMIIPLNYSDGYNGGIQILDLDQTKKFKKGNINFENESYFNMESKLFNILLFLPNVCYHKAGNPEINEGRKQLMLQLNPSTRWSINKNLYKKQFKIEPKFPFFSYLFDKKILLKD